MNELQTERQEIATALEPIGITVYKWVPEIVNGPALVLQPGSPWLEGRDEAFGDYRARWLLSVVLNVGTNEKLTDDLDTYVAQIIGLLNVEEVSAHFLFRLAGVDYMAVNITISHPIHFTTE